MYSSFSRGYYVYKDVWISITEDDSLTCEREEHNENDKIAVAIVWDDCFSKKIVGHVPLNWSKVASKFLWLTNHSCRGDWKESQLWCWIRTQNTCKLFFYGNTRVITWVKNSLEKLDNEFHIKVKKCVE